MVSIETTRESEEGRQEDKDSLFLPVANDTTNLLQNMDPPLNEKKIRGPIWWLTISIWSCFVTFGSYCLIHYLGPYLFQNPETAQDAWDMTDKHLYRPDDTRANKFMALHMIGGVILMLLGPVQFLKYVRCHYMYLHRCLGRIYIAAALLASIFASLWVIFWKTSRCNIHEDAGNLILGTSVAICASQTYRYARLKMRENHELWAWRLFACVLGAPLYRLYGVFYAVPVLFTPWQGNLVFENGMFYVIVIPNLVVLEFIWQRRQKQWDLNPTSTSYTGIPVSAKEKSSRTKLVPEKLIWFAFAFVAASSIGASLGQWIPAILNIDLSTGADGFLHDFCIR